MQLRNARLCLDCEEVHEAPTCPACASESFAFITRWVPAPDRPERQPARRPPEPKDPEELETYRQLLDPPRKGGRWKMVTGGALGLALVGVASWLWKGDGKAGGGR